MIADSKQYHPWREERSFGVIVGVVVSALAAFKLTRPGVSHAPVAGLVIGAILVFAGLAWPRSLRRPNQLWMQLGALLHQLTSPVILALLYFVVFTPIGFLLRCFRHDFFGLKIKTGAQTYWIPRTPPGPDPDFMKLQF